MSTKQSPSPKKLSLKAETLRRLDRDALAEVAGGASVEPNYTERHTTRRTTSR